MVAREEGVSARLKKENEKTKKKKADETRSPQSLFLGTEATTSKMEVCTERSGSVKSVPSK